MTVVDGEPHLVLTNGMGGRRELLRGMDWMETEHPLYEAHYMCGPRACAASAAARTR